MAASSGSLRSACSPGAGMAGKRPRGSGVAVLLDREPAAPAPCCPHGPALLFVKISQGKEEGRRFFACSACRDRKDCNFFQWEDEKVSEARISARKESNQSRLPSLYKQFALLPQSKRRLCQGCQQLLLPDEWGKHSTHEVLKDISMAQLKKPSQLLLPLENKKTNAQYLFADRSCQFLLDLIIALGFRRVLCVGTPRLHELIHFKASQEQKPHVESLLLDIDFRYAQFYTEEDFCHYNMFNHYFFGGEAAREVCRKFLHQNKGEGIIMVTDPPFGGLVEALAFGFQKLIAMWRERQEEELSVFWIFPYYFESRILEFFPSFSMLDYQVDYDNHALYKHGKTGRKQSPVRIFTNLSPSFVEVLQPQMFLRFCSLCQRYVTWSHCSTCNRCALPGHNCESINVGCFICGAMGHKRSGCPNLSVTKRKNKLKLGAAKRACVKHTGASRKKMKKKNILSH
uniref:rRNA N(6)-adenosine-methyltransferase ZCCHC4 n=1 Tax=Sphenodon punctatus TaxID=8508 RepID=A0A8D0H9B8_SPHPU